MTAMNIALDASGPKEADQRAITDKQMSVAHPTNFFLEKKTKIPFCSFKVRLGGGSLLTMTRSGTFRTYLSRLYVTHTLRSEHFSQVIPRDGPVQLYSLVYWERRGNELPACDF